MDVEYNYSTFEFIPIQTVERDSCIFRRAKRDLPIASIAVTP